MQQVLQLLGSMLDANGQTRERIMLSNKLLGLSADCTELVLPLTDSDMVTLAAQAAGNPNVKGLCVGLTVGEYPATDMGPLTDRGVVSMRPLLSVNTLVRLNLSGNKIGPMGAESCVSKASSS